MGQGQLGWLLVTIVTGPENSLRVRVWRELRRLGAVYLHNAVCLLPNRPEAAAAVMTLAEKVQAGGGRARILQVRLIDRAEEAAVIAEQVADRDQEYRELVERSSGFVNEIELEFGRGNTTYLEVEESEADLERFERWFASIAARDYFEAAGRDEAEAALVRCRVLLADFQAAALDAETETPIPSGRRAGLRVVGEEP
jgi:hypothetical protein